MPDPTLADLHEQLKTLSMQVNTLGRMIEGLKSMDHLNELRQLVLSINEQSLRNNGTLARAFVDLGRDQGRRFDALHTGMEEKIRLGVIDAGERARSILAMVTPPRSRSVPRPRPSKGARRRARNSASKRGRKAP